VGPAYVGREQAYAARALQPTRALAQALYPALARLARASQPTATVPERLGRYEYWTEHPAGDVQMWRQRPGQPATRRRLLSQRALTGRLGRPYALVQTELSAAEDRLGMRLPCSRTTHRLLRVYVCMHVRVHVLCVYGGWTSSGGGASGWGGGGWAVRVRRERRRRQG
jgi:hypothetical protein